MNTSNNSNRCRLTILSGLVVLMMAFLFGCPSDPGTVSYSDVGGQDACEPATCAELQVQCGSHDDGCGAEVDCGECSLGACSDNHICVCNQESDTELCNDHDAECGTLITEDSCGQNRDVDCGSCDTGFECGLEADFQCGCEPETCDTLDANCGEHLDGCGETIECGVCDDQAPHCAPSDEDNTAAFICTDDECETNECGDSACGEVEDGCGGFINCEGCDDEETCEDNQCVCDGVIDQDQWCDDEGYECGTHTAEDSCGNDVDVDCGGCQDNDTCDDDGMCSCEPWDEQKRCEESILDCGIVTIPDGCGGFESSDCGSCIGG